MNGWTRSMWYPLSSIQCQLVKRGEKWPSKPDNNHKVSYKKVTKSTAMVCSLVKWSKPGGNFWMCSILSIYIQWGTQHAGENCFPNTATTDMKRFQVFYCLCQGRWVCQSHSCQYNLTSLNFFLTLLSLIFNIYLPIIDAESGYLSIQKFGRIKAVGNRKSTMVYSGFLSNIWPPPLLGRMCWSSLNWAVISKGVPSSVGT